MSAGALGIDHDSADMQQNVAKVKDIVQDYAIKAWLTRFPGFVDNLADCLQMYSASLAGAANVYAADRLEDEPLNPCGPYYVLLSQLQTSRDSGQVSKADFEWFCTCTRTTMSEVAKAASAGASVVLAGSAPSVVPAVIVPTATPVAPGPGPSPVVCSSPSAPTIQTLPLLLIWVAQALMRSLQLVALCRTFWCLAALLLLLVPARKVGSSCILQRLFHQVGFIMFVFLLASVVLAYKFCSAFSVKKAICNVRMG
jgi:hypothetical protein